MTQAVDPSKGTVVAPESTVYFLQSGRKSYIGFAVNLPRRLRQHRGELVGGAKYTASWPNRRRLELVACITGFPTRQLALSYEWHAKRRHRTGRQWSSDVPTHQRLSSFFWPSTFPRFQDIRSSLRVTLFKHHDLRPCLIEKFNLSHVQCLAPL